MKKILSVLLVVAMCAAILCACTPSNPSTSSDPNSSSSSVENPPAPQGPEVVTLSDYFGDKSKWEDDGGFFEMDENKIFFNNFDMGDYAAVRLTEPRKDATYKFKLTIHKLAPVSMEDWTWWDSELCIIARSTLAGSSWQEDLSQKGYTLTSWGDMSEVAIGRCGYDEACGSFKWNVNDGKPHDIEFTVESCETGVHILLKVDGEVVADVIDDGKIRDDKPDRPTEYPDAGGLTIRCKYLEATVE